MPAPKLPAPPERVAAEAAVALPAGQPSADSQELLDRVDREVHQERQGDPPQQQARLAPAAPDGLDRHVNDEAGADAVGDREAERHQHDRQEGRQGEVDVAPGDVAHLHHQQEADHHQHRRGGLVGDDLDQRGEEQRDHEQQRGHHAGKPGAGALADPGRRLDVGGVGRAGGGPAGRRGTVRPQPVGVTLPAASTLGGTSAMALTMIAKMVVAMMLSRIAPRTRRATSTTVSSSPTQNTSVGQPASRLPMPSCTGTGVLAASGMRRTKPASTSPMNAMNRPMPTLMDCLRASGMASITAWRRPVATSTVISRPSSTTRPIASGQDIWPASWKATTALSPRPAAMANG